MTERAENAGRINVWRSSAVARTAAADDPNSEALNRMTIYRRMAEAREHIEIGGDSYHADAVHFDGATYLVNAALASSDGQAASTSAWIRVPAGAAYGPAWMANVEGIQNNNLTLNGDGTFYGLFGPQPTPIVWVSMTAAYNDDEWYHVIFSSEVQAGTPKFQMYLNGVAVPQPPIVAGTNAPFTGSELYDFNGLSLWVGSDSFNGNYTGDLADLWIAPGVSLLDGGGDIPEATLRKFIGADGKPIYLGANGELPTGAAPAVFMSGDAAAFATNQGTGGAFTTTGTLTDAGTSPSD